MTVQWCGDQVTSRVRQAALRGVIRGATRVHEEGTSLIQDAPATGRVYQRRGVTHQASAPGEPPASDTGTLAQSGEVRPKPSELVATVNWSTDYAASLEYGSQRIEPRPFARPALMNVRVEINEDVAAEIRNALR